jgi:Holliday junction resolvasome RuvABC ATP-dependent DNA helicase subunit
LVPHKQRGRRAKHHLLSLYGNPGTGKSTVAIFLVEELEESFAATNDKMLG